MTGTMYECHVHGPQAGDHCKLCVIHHAFFPPPAKTPIDYLPPQIRAAFTDRIDKLVTLARHILNSRPDSRFSILDSEAAFLISVGVPIMRVAEQQYKVTDQAGSIAICKHSVRINEFCEECRKEWKLKGEKIKTAAQAQDVLRRAGFATGDTARSLVDYALRAQMPPDDWNPIDFDEVRRCNDCSERWGLCALHQEKYGVNFRCERLSPEEILKREIANCPACQACRRHAYSDATTPGFFYTECEKHRRPGIAGAAGFVSREEMPIEEAKRRFPNWSPEHMMRMADAEQEALDGTGGLLAVSPEIYAEMTTTIPPDVADRVKFVQDTEPTKTEQKMAASYPGTEQEAAQAVADIFRETMKGQHEDTRHSGDSPSGIQQRDQGSGEAAGVEKLEGSGNRRKQPSQAKIEALKKIPGVTTATEINPKPRVACKFCGGYGKHSRGCKVISGRFEKSR